MLPSVAAAVIGGTSIMGGRGGYSGTIVGALILTVLTSLLIVAADARGRPPDPVRRHHRRRRGRLHADRRRVVSLHLGIDLGVTNLKWAVVEADGDDWQRSTAARSRPWPATARTPSSNAWRRSAGRNDRATASDRDARASACPGCTTRRPARPASSSTCRRTGGPAGRARRSTRPSGIPVALINDARAFGLAELRLGAGRGAESLVGLTLGTGHRWCDRDRRPGPSRA